jgi:hypothetical protein
MIQQEFAAQVLPDLPDNEDVYCEFNIAEKMRGSFEEQAAAMSTHRRRSLVMTRNEGSGPELNLSSSRGRRRTDRPHERHRGRPRVAAGHGAGPGGRSPKSARPAA